AVMRGRRASRFADDDRMLDAARIAHAGDAVHDIARVLVHRVVHRRLEIRVAAVVVDAEPAADIDVLQARAHELELRVHVRELVDRVFDAANVLQLASRVTVNELEAIEHAVRFQRLDELQDLAHEQAELRLLARGAAPAAGAFARELHAYADARADLILLRVTQHERELLEVLDHRDDRAAELRREDDRLDIAVVLESVADDHAVGRAFRHRHHREQLGLRSGLKTEAVFLTVAVHLFHDEALLIHFDGEDGAIAILVVVFLYRAGERFVQTAEAMPQDVGEAHDDRCRQIARVQTLDDFEQIDLRVRLCIGTHDDVPSLIDAEVPLAPFGHLVEIERIFDAPLSVQCV